MKEKIPTIESIGDGLRGIAHTKKMNVGNVFVDFLDYIIGFFSPVKAPVEGWAKKYDKEDNRAFYGLMADYFQIMKKQLARKLWFDAFGDLFMSIHVKGNNNAQFFTPDDVCSMLAETTLLSYNGEREPMHDTPFGKRVIINDCACGSARLPLAAKAIFDKNGWRAPYLVCEDIDPTCCKMAAINMAMHGCFGEVICHDALCEPDKLKLGYITCETMWPFPTFVPSIRPCNDARCFVGIARWKEIKTDNVRTKEQGTKKRQPQQLELF